MKNTYHIQENKLIINDTEIVFDFPIDNYIEISDMLIILLSIPVKVKYNENVFGISLAERKIKWQIEKKRYKLQPFTRIHCKYSGIAIYKNQLRLNNWCDAYLIVDPYTGKVLRQEETR